MESSSIKMSRTDGFLYDMTGLRHLQDHSALCQKVQGILCAHLIMKTDKNHLYENAVEIKPSFITPLRNAAR